MKTILTVVSAMIVGIALGWGAASTIVWDHGPADVDEMYAEMSSALDQYTDTLERASRVTALSRQVSPDNLEGAVRAFHERAAAPHLTAFDLQVFLAAWARIEQESILEQTGSWGSDRFHHLAVAAVMHELARRGEFDRAREILLRTPDGAREQAIAALFVSWARFGHVDGVEEIFSKLQAGAERDVAMQILANQVLLARGSDVLISWVEGLETPGPEGFKLGAFEHAVRSLALRDVEKAKEWVSRLWAQHVAWSRRGPEFLVSSWSRSDPKAAVEWALALEAGDDAEKRVRGRAFDVGMERWIQSHADQAAFWVVMRPMEPVYDAHAEALAMHYARRLPPRAAVFSNRIVRQQARDRVQALLRRDWSRLDRHEELYAMMGPDGPTTWIAPGGEP